MHAVVFACWSGWRHSKAAHPAVEGFVAYFFEDLAS
jgi:hypothetical protein